MANKSTKLGGTDYATSDDPLAADMNDTNDAIAEKIVWSERNYIGDGNDNKVMACTASIWQTEDRRTDDAGVTWAASNLVDDVVFAVCAADKTNAFSLSAAGAGKYTSDSWATINNTTTDVPNSTAIYDASFITVAVGVCCGDPTAGNKGIWLTTNGGDDWVVATTVTNDLVFYSIDMFDATYGIALAADGSIWYTDDGGVEWIDSTFNYGATDEEAYIKVLTAAAGTAKSYFVTTAKNLKAQTNGSYRIYTGADLTASGSLIYVGIGTGAVSNIVKTTNGNLYFAQHILETNAVTLWKSDDSGTTWQTQIIGATAGGATYATSLQEYDTNKLLIVLGNGNLMKYNWDG